MFAHLSGCPDPHGRPPLRWAASTVSALLDAGLEMDEATLAAAFRATADVVDRAEADG